MNSGLTNSFYEKLNSLVYLNELKSFRIEDNEDLHLKFDFILNLKNLKEFYTNQNIQNHIDLISKLFNHDNLIIENFHFKFDTKYYIEIDRFDFNDFNIDCYYLDDFLERVDFFSIDDLDLNGVVLELKNLVS